MEKRGDILIADDEYGVRDMLARKLKNSGGSVVEANCLEGVENLIRSMKGNPPEVAILDGSMPNKGDGQKAADKLRQAFPSIVIISYSADKQTFGDFHVKKGPIGSSGEIKDIITSISGK